MQSTYNEAYKRPHLIGYRPDGTFETHWPNIAEIPYIARKRGHPIQKYNSPLSLPSSSPVLEPVPVPVLVVATVPETRSPPRKPIQPRHIITPLINYNNNETDDHYDEPYSAPSALDEPSTITQLAIDMIPHRDVLAKKKQVRESRNKNPRTPTQLKSKKAHVHTRPRNRLSIPVRHVKRLIGDLLYDQRLGAHRTSIRLERSAFSAIHLALESFVQELLMNSAMCMIHRGRKTLVPKDIHLAMALRYHDLLMPDNLNLHAIDYYKHCIYKPVF